MLKAAVMGYGTIGSGVVEVLDINRDLIAERAGQGIEIKYILDIRDFPGTPIQEKVVHDYKVIAEDPEIQIVVETMGGVEPAYTFVKAMLEAGKHVTTSNKALVAEKGAGLLALAKEKNVNFMFEASVGGGIPIIRTMLNALTADEMEEITGILNGTTNYMMTKMSREGLEFADVLLDAQQKGYAEKDPSADIEGYDACRKIAILTSLACGQQVDYQDIYTEGITKVSAVDITYAKQMGRAVKLLAVSKKTPEGYAVFVAPHLLTWRRNVLWQRRRQASDGLGGCSGYGWPRTAYGLQYPGRVEARKDIAFRVWQNKKRIFCAYLFGQGRNKRRVWNSRFCGRGRGWGVRICDPHNGRSRV